MAIKSYPSQEEWDKRIESVEFCEIVLVSKGVDGRVKIEGFWDMKSGRWLLNIPLISVMKTGKSEEETLRYIKTDKIFKAFLAGMKFEAMLVKHNKQTNWYFVSQEN